MQEGALDRAKRGVRPCNSDTGSYLPYTYLDQREGWGVGGVVSNHPAYPPPTPQITVTPSHSVLANRLIPLDNRFRDNRCITAKREPKANRPPQRC